MVAAVVSTVVAVVVASTVAAAVAASTVVAAAVDTAAVVVDIAKPKSSSRTNGSGLKTGAVSFVDHSLRRQVIPASDPLRPQKNWPREADLPLRYSSTHLANIFSDLNGSN
jgi:hypothetical protein